ncbi:beta-glucosidase [Opitutaceae bacterium EW11]|nr:beta-glucosidase [Opitutaceae bacterium EW11]
MSQLRFPHNFIWGVATAAPQIEGAAFDDGKGPSVWDMFSRVPGKILNGDTLDVACDHYHRYRDDIALMVKLGVKHYRLSIAWPRIYPQGRGAVNQPGIDFYNRLIDALLDKGITPWVTMFHWDLPQSLEDEGGWRVRGIVDSFGNYADTIVKAYGDRVKNWITLNEIFCFTRLGYGTGLKAPGAKEPEAVVNQTFHHALLCHGHGVRAVREHGRRGARVGLTDNPAVSIPVTASERDIAATREAFIDDNTRVLEPLFNGRYHPRYLRAGGANAPRVQKGDFDLITLPTDFLGLNLYTGTYVRAGRRGQRYERLAFPANHPRADSPWLSLAPQTMYWGTRLVTDLYGDRPLYITENGAGYDDLPPVDGEVIDLHRREYVRNCLRELHDAIHDGVPVRGYFLWSFMDNYEWEDGYQRRFGIVYNDFATQKRTPKLSAKWYSEVMKANALV